MKCQRGRERKNNEKYREKIEKILPLIFSSKKSGRGDGVGIDTFMTIVPFPVPFAAVSAVPALESNEESGMSRMKAGRQEQPDPSDPSDPHIVAAL